MEEVQAKIEDPAGNRLAVDEHMLLRKMPAARTHKQGCRFLLQRVLFAFGASIANGTIDRVTQVDVALDGAFPRW